MLHVKVLRVSPKSYQHKEFFFFYLILHLYEMVDVPSSYYDNFMMAIKSNH